jgi:type IV pilus assembly protein PilY1
MMKKIQQMRNIDCYSKKALAMSMSALMTTLFCSSVTTQLQASDIDIYQAAKSSNITLMFMLDTSGSMTGSSSCDIPNGYSYTGTGSDAATTARPYERDYCTASAMVYYYKKDSSGNYFSCKTSTATTTLGSKNQSDCIYSILKPSNSTLNLYSNTSTTPKYYYKSADTSTNFYDRITRVKDGMFDLLQGSSTVTKLSDDKVIGLSAFSYNGSGRAGYIIIPARRLDATVNGVTQRQLLLNAIANLSARGGTPTANAYADAAAYLMGTTTQRTSNQAILRLSGFNSDYYARCTAIDGSGNCTNFNGYYTGFSSIASSYNSTGNTGSYAGYTGTYYSGPLYDLYSGFQYSSSDSKGTTNYIQPTSLSGQTSSTTQCNGQGIYVLTDGEPNSSGVSIAQPLMQTALGSSYSNLLTCSGALFTDSASSDTAWQCISDFSQLLLNKQNSAGIAIKTAVVGFGSDFNGLTSYSSALTQQQNILNINNNTSAPTNVKNAAKWGVYGGGGWYSGASSADVVASVNGFIGQLSTNIPPVTTGAATIPVDQLNTATLQNYAYFSQFQPTPGADATPQLWQGNLKKYNVVNGLLEDIKGNAVVNSSGKIVDNYDLWSSGITDNSMALIGGVKAQLNLGLDSSNTPNRKVLINRDSSGNPTDTTLNAITTDYLTSSDADRAYLLSLLGYNIDPGNVPSTLDGLKASSELRQVGAVMHSSPLLMTNQGKMIAASDGSVSSTNRQDYVLFGTTQGLLHVVDASTGQEKFVFVPDEMVQMQKQAFLKYDTTAGADQ